MINFFLDYLLLGNSDYVLIFIIIYNSSIVKARCFSSCHERGTNKNSEFQRGIESQTFGFRAPMLYH